MASLHGPKAKTQRRFGELLVPRAKYAKILDKRGFPPGDHGREKQFRSGRRSAFATQLEEKQKLSFIYNVRERQLRNYYKKAIRMTGPTGGNMLSLLERRLDNVIYKAGLGATMWASRQLVVHGHVLVNGNRLDLPSYEVKTGDVITLTEKMRKNVHVEEWIDQISAYPAYMEVDKKNMTVNIVHVPAPGEIQVQVDIQLVVEYYNRLT